MIKHTFPIIRLVISSDFSGYKQLHYFSFIAATIGVIVVALMSQLVLAYKCSRMHLHKDNTSKKVSNEIYT